ncbi:MAG: protein translocase subunit SecD, partial [Acidobacteriota bacterium]
MGKKLRWRVLLIVLVVAGAIAGFVLTGYAHARKEWSGPGGPTPTDALKKAIKLGLDLRGGIHLVLQVTTSDAVKAERDDAVETLKKETKDAGTGPVEFPTNTSFIVGITDKTDQTKVEDAVKRFLPEWTYSTAGGKWTFAMKDPARRQIEDNAVAQAVETIRNRIDEFGVSEPLIAREGSDRILVQLPGIDDPKRVKDLIKNTAFLELSL